MKTNLERLTETTTQIEADVVGDLKHPAHLAQWEYDKTRIAEATEESAAVLEPELARYWLVQIKQGVARTGTF